MPASRTASRMRSISGDSFTRELRKYSSMNAAQSFTDFAQIALLEVLVHSKMRRLGRKSHLETISLHIPWIARDEDFREPENIGAVARGLLDERDDLVHTTLQVVPSRFGLDRSDLYSLFGGSGRHLLCSAVLS